MTLNDAGMLNYLPVLFFVSYSSLGTATSFCLSLSLPVFGVFAGISPGKLLACLGSLGTASLQMWLL